MASPTIPPPQPSVWRTALDRRWVGPAAAALGLTMAALDVALLRALGIDVRLGDADGTWAIFALFAGTYAALGFVIGRLLEARHALRAQRGVIAAHTDTIEAQLKALEASQAAALEAERLATLGQLAAGVAHEVRNPLGVIRASASMTQEDLSPEGDGWQAMGFIVAEVDRLNAFVTTMLEVARPVAPERRRPTDPRAAVEKAVSLARDTLRGLGITVEARCEGAPQVQGDEDLLTQLLLGLLTNAGQSLAPGGEARGGRILISCDASPSAVALRVADDGPGIPPEDVGRVFDPFFTTRAGGTGLGLTMAQRIVHWHGGTLIAEAGAGCGAGGRGACFTITLPRAAAPIPLTPPTQAGDTGAEP